MTTNENNPPLDRLEVTDAMVQAFVLTSSVAPGDNEDRIKAGLRAAFARPPEVGLRVKPLEWGELGPGFYRAKAPLFGNIRIEKYGPRYTTCYSVPGYSNVFADGEFATAEEAKAAAETEYQKRMTAALSAPATEVDHG